MYSVPPIVEAPKEGHPLYKGHSSPYSSNTFRISQRKKNNISIFRQDPLQPLAGLPGGPVLPFSPWLVFQGVLWSPSAPWLVFQGAPPSALGWSSRGSCDLLQPLAGLPGGPPSALSRSSRGVPLQPLAGLPGGPVVPFSPLAGLPGGPVVTYEQS